MTKKIKVWDVPTRLFHWLLVVLFAMSSYSAFESKFGFYGDMHLYSGVAIIALLLWRLVWGLIGSETARFTSFMKWPASVLSYLRGKQTDKALGHNPLGGYSVILMLVLILTQAVLGLFATDGMLFSGPFSIDAGDNTDLITDIHETLGLVLLYVTGFHVFAVLVYLFVKKTNLISPMITGYDRFDNGQRAPYMKNAFWALLTAVIIGGAVYWYILG
ncbi:cytochrome b/b6 domain-containing protein [Kordiimonas sp. SCSIO 12610]|uniref:cytochrome b/b6 domain-containing protein n=1 Tax=Kordiimonas sp. SCSIO 12610 TaxID=2829597 RepID=UPI00210ECBF0|nr:cytochrome b/b6 domain-containing protein [Kordiimonas sp. SCSIO 12610]UTW55324.1 cytochrome b/b6 domain-containing protein [Kordiimonas sp. SCSIO 12610]